MTNTSENTSEKKPQNKDYIANKPTIEINGIYKKKSKRRNERREKSNE